MAIVTNNRLSLPDTILCILLTGLMLVCFITGTLDLAVWVMWQVGEARRA